MIPQIFSLFYKNLLWLIDQGSRTISFSFSIIFGVLLWMNISSIKADKIQIHLIINYMWVLYRPTYKMFLIVYIRGFVCRIY